MMYVVKKDLAKIVILVALAVLLVGATFAFTNSSPPKHAAANQVTSNVSLTIQDVYEQKTISVTKNETVLQVLQALNASDPTLRLATKTYTGMGELVTAMGTHKNGDDGKYWQYKVNGVMTQIGAGAYALQGGEQVEWFFGASQE